jgi:uncharacterized RDD family membrane protein YckC
MADSSAQLTCPSCGERVYATDTQCMSCGADLRAKPAAAPPPPQPTVGPPPAPPPDGAMDMLEEVPVAARPVGGPVPMAPPPPAPAYPPAPPPVYPGAPRPGYPAAPPPMPYAPQPIPRSPMSPARGYADYAGFWRRFVAAIVDGIVMNVVTFPIGFALGFGAAMTGKSGAPEAAQIGAAILGAVVGWLYYALMESSSYQATLGKMALGVIVTDVDGNRIGFGRATGRYFGKIISALICYIGFIMAGFTERKQALHDMMVGCLVVTKG